MKTYLRILNYVKPYKFLVLITILTSLVFVIMNSLSIWMIGTLISTIINPETIVNQPDPNSLNEQFKLWTQQLIGNGNQLKQLKSLCILLFSIFILKNIAFYTSQICLAFVENNMMGDIRNKLFKHIQNLPFSFFDKNKTSEMTSIIVNDVSYMRQVFAQSIQNLLVEPLNIIIFISLLFIISPKWLFIVSIVFPIASFFIIKIGQSVRRKAKRSSIQIADLINVMNETFSGIRIVKAFNKEKFEIKRFLDKNIKLVNLNFYQSRISSLNTPINDIIGVSVGIALIWYGGSEVINGSSGLNSDDFMKFLLLLFALMQHIRKVGHVNALIQLGLASGDRIFSILDTENNIVNAKKPVHINTINKKIVFENVSFTYESSERPAIDNINIEIEKGKIIAIVGESGSGKTTFIDLIPRFYDTTSGEVLIDDINVKNINLTDLRSLIGIVSQEVVLFNDTISNNISYGNKNDTDGIIKAAEAANALEFIKSLPKGFDTIIGEKGTLLSGGQRQRLSIARAIYKNPDILIFDEATSSLDSKSEKKVQIAIDNLIKDRTVIVIAHRLSTIMSADEIFVFDNGKIIENGSHDELLSYNGKYNNLYKMQHWKINDK